MVRRFLLLETRGKAVLDFRNENATGALVDALMQRDMERRRVESTVIEPLARAHGARRELAGRKAAATRVDFYTVARGEAA